MAEFEPPRLKGNIGGFVDAHAAPNPVAPIVQIEQLERFNMHGVSFSLLEVAAMRWREVGSAALPRPLTPEREALLGILPQDPLKASMEDYLDLLMNGENEDNIARKAAREAEEALLANKGAILLGTLAETVHGMKLDGTFSTYMFTSLYNEAVYGTETPRLPFVGHKDETVLSDEEQEGLERSFALDPTGAHAMSNPMLWPHPLQILILREELDEVREEMVRQIPFYKDFTERLLQENPQASERYNELHLDSKVLADIQNAAGDL